MLAIKNCVPLNLEHSKTLSGCASSSFTTWLCHQSKLQRSQVGVDMEDQNNTWSLDRRTQYQNIFAHLQISRWKWATCTSAGGPSIWGWELFSLKVIQSVEITHTTAKLHSFAWEKWELARDELPELQLLPGRVSQSPGHIEQSVIDRLRSIVKDLPAPKDYSRSAPKHCRRW